MEGGGLEPRLEEEEARRKPDAAAHARERTAEGEDCELAGTGPTRTDAASEAQDNKDGTDEEACEPTGLTPERTDAALKDGSFRIKRGTDEEACELPGLAPEQLDAASKDSGSSTLQPSGSRKYRRRNSKSTPCGSCGGPCRLGCCSIAEENSEYDAGRTEREDGAPPRNSDSDTPTGALFRQGLPRAGAPHATNQSGSDVRNAPDGSKLEDYSDTGVDCAAADAFSAAVKRLRDSRLERPSEAAVTTQVPRPALKRGRDLGAEATDGRRKKQRQAPLPSNFGAPPDWLKRKPKVGGVALDPSHTPHLAYHRGVTWCWACGTFALEVPNKLRLKCQAPTVAGARQLVRLRLGLTPRNTFGWPVCSEPLTQEGEEREGSLR